MFQKTVYCIFWYDFPELNRTEYKSMVEAGTKALLLGMYWVTSIQEEHVIIYISILSVSFCENLFMSS